ncbi:MAG: guanylate kinase [Deltaproteobacteria bacterium]|nr:guanylate kinase [Deltaproteobacteria bacterium]
MKKNGILFILSGPSGAGKSTLGNMAVARYEELVFSISYTTRKPRPGERDGFDYNFIDDKTFDEMASSGEFVEFAGVHGRKYGTAREDLEDLLKDGINVLLDIDVQGAEQLKKIFKDGVFIFVSPPSLEVCEARLRDRGNLAINELKDRLITARDEMEKSKEYDFCIVNNVLEESFKQLSEIIDSKV